MQPKQGAHLLGDLTWPLLDNENPCRVQPTSAHLQQEDKTATFKFSGAAASAHRQCRGFIKRRDDRQGKP